MKKRLLAFVLALVMVVSILPVSVFATEVQPLEEQLLEEQPLEEQPLEEQPLEEQPLEQPLLTGGEEDVCYILGDEATTYATLKDGFDNAAENDTVVLLQDCTLEEDVGVPAGVTVALNGYYIDVTENGAFLCGDPFTFLITCERDLHTAAKLSQQTKTMVQDGPNYAGYSYTWKLANDIALTAPVEVSYCFKSITFDGNGYTVHAADTARGAAHAAVFSFGNDGEVKKEITLKNLTVTVGEGFADGISLDRGTARLDVKLDNVALVANHTVATRKARYTAPANTLLRVNDCLVALDGPVKLTTDATCLNAVSLTGGGFIEQHPNGAFSLPDGRSESVKAAHPVIETDDGSLVFGADLCGLEYVAADTGRYKVRLADGYDCSAAKNGCTYYCSLEDAIDDAEKGDTIVLLTNVTMSRTVGVPDNITVVLNDCDVRSNGCGFHAGKNFTFAIGSEKDLQTAAALSQTSEGYSFTWKLLKSFTVAHTTKVESNYAKITVNGNGKTITGEGTGEALTDNAEKFVLDFQNSGEAAKEVELKNLTVEVGNGFCHGIEFHKSTGTVNALLNNVSVVMNRTTQPLKKGTGTTGVAIQNNACSITVKNTLSITTDVYCWAAMDMDKSGGDAALSFGKNAKVKVTDGRNYRNIRKEPVIGFSDDDKTANSWVVDEAACAAAGLLPATKGGKSGLDTPVVVVNGKGYLTLADAFNAITDDTPVTLKLLRDTYEQVAVIPAGSVVTLDLNGYMLKNMCQPASALKIDTGATVTIKDSGSTVTRSYRLTNAGLQTINQTEDAPPLGELTAVPNDLYDITVTGGVITGGSNTADVGGGIANFGTLTIEGGNIVGNRATYGGGIANFGTLNIKGGVIALNRADHGGGIYNADNGVLTVEGGEVALNTAQYYGGAVYNRSDFTLKNGTIRLCRTTETKYGLGGAVFNIKNFTMDGGVIEGCEAGECGGAVFSDGIADNQGVEPAPGEQNPTVFTLNGGEIKDCHAPNHGEYDEAVYIRHSVMEMNGGKLEGMIFRNDSTSCRDDGQPCGHTHYDCQIRLMGGLLSEEPDARNVPADSKIVPNTDSATKGDYPYCAIEQAEKCVYLANFGAEDGEYVIVLNGNEVSGKYLVQKSGNGYTVSDGGYYFGYDGYEFNVSDQQFVWQYDGGLYTTVSKTTTTRGFFRSRSKTTTTKLYLTCDEENMISVATGKVTAQLQIVADEHTYAYTDLGNDYHEGVCSKCGNRQGAEKHVYDQPDDKCICGKLNPANNKVTDVEVAEKQVKSSSGSRFGGWFSRSKKTAVTQYQYTISPVCQNVTAKKVLYSLDGENWKTGTGFTNATQLDTFKIQVVDSNNVTTDWVYKDKDVFPAVESHTLTLDDEFSLLTTSSFTDGVLTVSGEQTVSLTYSDSSGNLASLTDGDDILVQILEFEGLNTDFTNDYCTITGVTYQNQVLTFTISNMTMDMTLYVDCV